MTKSASIEAGTRFIWATRGKSWGFRFLRSGGYHDPLRVYEHAFADVSDEREVFHRSDPHTVALRIPDPEGRCDSSGRVIPHDFVLIGRWANEIASLDEGLNAIWPLVSDEFASMWDVSEPPATQP